MKNLKSIHLKNFQSHKNTLITFAEQGCLTVITGPSDNGKSAVIRALRWVYYNVPQGDGFIFNAEDKCSVLVNYDDGTTVERIRSRGGINRYVVNGKTLEGFGIGVPLEVQQATGIRKLEIGDQSFFLNLSEQLDGPFLGGKSVSGPARAKVLGKLAGTEEIDYANKQVGTDLTRAKKQKEIYERDIEGLGKQIGRYSFIHGWERTAARAEIVLEDAKQKVATIGELRKLAGQWMEISDKVLTIKMLVAGLQGVDKGLDLVQKASGELTKGNALAALRGSHIGAFLQSERSRNILAQLDPILKVAEPMLKEILESNLKLSRDTTINNNYNSFSRSVLSLKAIVEGLSEVNQALETLQKASKENEQLIKLEGLDAIYERTSHWGLACRRLLKNLSCVDPASDYLNKVIPELQKKSSLLGLTTQYQKLIVLVLYEEQNVERLMRIDQANDLLFQASKDSLRQARIQEASKLKTSLDQKIIYLNEGIGRLQKEVKTAESDYLNLMESLGKCPTCGHDININKLREVM